MIDLIILSLNSSSMFSSLRFMLTSNELSTINDFSLMNSLILRVELCCLEVNILKVFKVVNAYTLRNIIDEF